MKSSAQPRRMLSISRAESRAAMLFVGLWAVGFTVFLLYPLLASIYYSFCDYSVLRSPIWIGLSNYRGLWHDEVFWITLKNTATYAAMALPLGLIVAMSLALLLNGRVPGMPLFRTIFFLPSLLPLVSLAVLWLWVFNGEHGILNVILRYFHINGPNWLGDPTWSKPTLALLAM